MNRVGCVLNRTNPVFVENPMRKFLQVILISVSALSVVSTAFGQLPRYRDVPVNDYAHIISPSYEQRMDALSREVLEKTGAALVVATVEDMDGMEVDDYANRLFEAWGIGRQGEDKGVLFLLAARERRVRIEVGYGLEGILPDGRAGSILDRYALPDFREGDYGRGFYRAMLAVAGIIAEDAGVQITGAVAPRTVSRSSGDREDERGGNLFFIIIFIFLMIVTRGRILPWLFLSMMMGGGRGGGFGGGGFSGGFGGFGGGMSGGGGASRSF